MEIRRLGPADVLMACDVAAAFKSSTAQTAHMARVLANGNNYLLVACNDDHTLGFALAYELRRIDTDCPMMCLYEISTHPDHRRKGVARALIGELCRICKERGVVKMWVITNESNGAAMSLYASTGGHRPATDDVVFEFTEFKIANAESELFDQ